MVIYSLLAIIILALGSLFAARKCVICVEAQILPTVFLVKYCILQIIKHKRITNHILIDILLPYTFRQCCIFMKAYCVCIQICTCKCLYDYMHTDLLTHIA